MIRQTRLLQELRRLCRARFERGVLHDTLPMRGKNLGFPGIPVVAKGGDGKLRGLSADFVIVDDCDYLGRVNE